VPNGTARCGVFATTLFWLGMFVARGNSQVISPCDEVNPADVEVYLSNAIKKYAGGTLIEPPSVTPTDPTLPLELDVRYGINVVAGCQTTLRNYNGMIVGPTIRVKPGDTINLKLKNSLPPDRLNNHPQKPLIHDHMTDFSFDITNLHTHGLHVDPVGTSEDPPEFAGDNVLISVFPSKEQKYRITVPKNHPSGLYWYHPHFHGSTAIQVSSGMAGALIIEGGDSSNGNLMTIPEISAAKQTTLLLQQIRFGPDGKLESMGKVETSKFRPTLVNGQFVPTIEMRPGEVQRFSFVHSGVRDKIHLAIDQTRLLEVAVDGISLGRIVEWPSAESIVGDNGLILGPGQRSEVLVKAPFLVGGESSQLLNLWDMQLSPMDSISAMSEIQHLRNMGQSNLQKMELSGKPKQLLARILIKGLPLDMSLPKTEQMQNLVTASLPAPSAEEFSMPVTQRVKFSFGYNVTCDANGYCNTDPTSSCATGSVECYSTVYLVDSHVFSNTKIRNLKLNATEIWDVSGEENSHPFHVHVNPFYLFRDEPQSNGTISTLGLWRDTVMLPPNGEAVRLLSRSKDFVGRFVLHCHILNHEDRGMMQLVEIHK
jgi:FtsP/CotA-like multicopper oxidase with cupredoxin domain